MVALLYRGLAQEIPVHILAATPVLLFLPLFYLFFFSVFLLSTSVRLFLSLGPSLEQNLTSCAIYFNQGMLYILIRNIHFLIY